MLALIQRVTHANVKVKGHIIGEIEKGLLAFVGIEKNDTKQQADRLLKRLLGYRIFADENDKMNLSVRDIAGGLLLVPQFTLAADTRKGMRPSFTPAAEPAISKTLFDYFVCEARKMDVFIATGEFGADMQVSLCNDGPVTFILR